MSVGSKGISQRAFQHPNNLLLNNFQLRRLILFISLQQIFISYFFRAKNTQNFAQTRFMIYCVLSMFHIQIKEQIERLGCKLKFYLTDDDRQTLFNISKKRLLFGF